jgi:hypothetical protein
VCRLFKNCSNLSLNSSDVYLYNSELMLSSPGLLPFSITLMPFLIHLMPLKYLCDCSNSISVLVHLCLLSLTIVYSTAEIHFHLCFCEFLLFPLHPFLFVLKFCTPQVKSYVSCVLNM